MSASVFPLSFCCFPSFVRLWYVDEDLDKKICLGVSINGVSCVLAGCWNDYGWACVCVEKRLHVLDDFCTNYFSFCTNFVLNKVRCSFVSREV